MTVFIQIFPLFRRCSNIVFEWICFKVSHRCIGEILTSCQPVCQILWKGSKNPSIKSYFFLLTTILTSSCSLVLQSSKCSQESQKRALKYKYAKYHWWCKQYIPQSVKYFHNFSIFNTFSSSFLSSPLCFHLVAISITIYRGIEIHICGTVYWTNLSRHPNFRMFAPWESHNMLQINKFKMATESVKRSITP